MTLTIITHGHQTGSRPPGDLEIVLRGDRYHGRIIELLKVGLTPISTTNLSQDPEISQPSFPTPYSHSTDPFIIGGPHAGLPARNKRSGATRTVVVHGTSETYYSLVVRCEMFLRSASWQSIKTLLDNVLNCRCQNTPTNKII